MVGEINNREGKEWARYKKSKGRIPMKNSNINERKMPKKKTDIQKGTNCKKDFTQKVREQQKNSGRMSCRKTQRNGETCCFTSCKKRKSLRNKKRSRRKKRIKHVRRQFLNILTVLPAESVDITIIVLSFRNWLHNSHRPNPCTT
jgi:hypothetical protein